jgi:hypothetical protein
LSLDRATATPLAHGRFYFSDVTRLVTMMTPAASVSFIGSEFNDFLHASIGMERNDMPLTVLSALARLNLDPWGEAAELSELPKHTATQRLAALIARLPSGRWVHTDCETIADRLIGLLPQANRGKVPSAQGSRGLPRKTSSAIARILLFAALGITASIIIAASREPPSRGGDIDMPDSITTSRTPPQSR